MHKQQGQNAGHPGHAQKPVFEVAGFDPNGRKFRKRVEADSARAAAEQFRRRGHAVRSSTQVSAVELERDCPDCGRSNDRERVRCTECRAVLRGQSVPAEERVHLPSHSRSRLKITGGYDVRWQADGAAIVRPVGWAAWKEPIGCLGVLSFLVLFVSLLAEAFFPDWIRLPLYVLLAGISLPILANTFFKRTEWLVAKDRLTVRISRFGKPSTEQFTSAAIIVYRRVDFEHRTSYTSYHVDVEGPDGRYVLCSPVDTQFARVLGRFFAQQTRWPLDDRLPPHV